MTTAAHTVTLARLYRLVPRKSISAASRDPVVRGQPCRPTNPRPQFPHTTFARMASSGTGVGASTEEDKQRPAGGQTHTQDGKSPRPPIVITGPSGAGKSTVLKRLFDKYPERFMFSVSHTTRSPRPGERDGEAYHFVTPPAFAALIEAGAFVEHARFGANLYGTSAAAVAAVAAAGKTCVLDIEMEGVKQVAASAAPALRGCRFLFLQPPGLDELERRLRGRGTDGDEDVKRRLERASAEMAFARERAGELGARVVVNDDLEKAWKEVEEFCLAES